MKTPSPKPLLYLSALLVVVSGIVLINNSFNYLFPITDLQDSLQNQGAQVNGSLSVVSTGPINSWYFDNGKGPIKENTDPMNMKNQYSGKALFVNSYSPKWNLPSPPITTQDIREKALNPETPAPALELLMANNVLQAGDVIFLRGGVYYWDKTKYKNSSGASSRDVQIVGTPSQPVTIKSYPGEQAILTHTFVATDWTDAEIINGNKTYQKVLDSTYNIAFQNHTPLISNNGSIWRMNESTLSPFESFGALIYPSTNVIKISLPNNENPSNYIMRIGVNNSIFSFFGYDNSSRENNYIIEDLTFQYNGTPISVGAYSNVVIRNCRFYDSAGSVIGIGKQNHVSIYNNYINNAGSTLWDNAIYIAGDNSDIHNNFLLNVSGSAIIVSNPNDRPINNKIYNNIIGSALLNVYGGSKTLADGTRSGITDWGNQNEIYNNIIYGDHGTGASFQSENGRFYNNIIVGANVGMHFPFSESKDTQIKNNIFVNGTNSNNNDYFVYHFDSTSNRLPILSDNIFYSL